MKTMSHQYIGADCHSRRWHHADITFFTRRTKISSNTFALIFSFHARIFSHTSLQRHLVLLAASCHNRAFLPPGCYRAVSLRVLPLVRLFSGKRDSEDGGEDEGETHRFPQTHRVRQLGPARLPTRRSMKPSNSMNPSTTRLHESTRNVRLHESRLRHAATAHERPHESTPPQEFLRNNTQCPRHPEEPLENPPST